MNNIGFIFKNNKITDEELIYYDEYISKILYEHKNDIVKTFDYKREHLLLKNKIFYQIKDNLNEITIKGTYNKPFIGKLFELTDILLTVIINKKLFKYYKI
jgi:hypothetical protein